MKLRFWTNDEARHRAPGDANTSAHDPTFQPRHCAGPEQGVTCTHDHPGDTEPWQNFAPLDRLVELDARGQVVAS